MKDRVRLTRPIKGKAALEPIGTPVADRGPPPPPPPRVPTPKSPRAIRANRPALLEPIADDAELFRGLQRSMTALWALMVVTVVLLRVYCPESQSCQLLATAILVCVSAFLGCGPRGWNPWRSSRQFGY